MTPAELALIASIIATGLFSGLMMTLVLVNQRIWAAQNAAAYIADMQTFLPAAKGHPVIATLTLLPFLAPIVAIVAYAGDGGARLALVIAGTLLAAGPFFVTLRFNFPIYDAIMGWEPGSEPAGWQAVRRRFYVLNLTRLLLAFSAMLCFLLALVVE